MRLLLDTNALVWALTAPRKLRPEAARAIEDPANDVLVSAASMYEISLKGALGKLSKSADVVAEVPRAGFGQLSITWDHGVVAGGLSLRHRDPFDRILVAQAQVEGLTIVTSDKRIAEYGVAVLPA
jgi:PIN domain nuclease of toxin-antitoxin system